MKIIAYILPGLLFLTFSHLPVSAQKSHSKAYSERRSSHHNRPTFSEEEFRKKKEDFITRTIPLTPEEAHSVLPYIHELKSAQRANDMKIRNLRRSINAHTPSSKCLATLKEIRDLQYANLKLETDYQKKFLKVLSPYKYFRLLNADNDFDRKILHEMVGFRKKGFSQRSDSSPKND